MTVSEHEKTCESRRPRVCLEILMKHEARVFSNDFSIALNNNQKIFITLNIQFLFSFVFKISK